MTPQPLTTPRPRPLPAPTDRDRRAWVAPTAATLALVLLVPPAMLFGMLSPMATDSCGPDDCSQALTTTLTLIMVLLIPGGLVTFVTWCTAWLLPRTQRWSVPRALLATVSVLPPLCVLLLVFTLPQG
ncbi:hypothetical protein G3I32_26865 [Streptomyces coelicoflavus]|uniref:Uncharacterized protein n=1 Tax=Streptomyces coelicoflavus TaxID=285562 RepID=A0A7K3PR29_9ACTN|nr:hypothetical protein [Streptomyces coelicoflavus]NEB12414.1 hypothetical protein [Streptomyces coelicoflavus]